MEYCLFVKEMPDKKLIDEVEYCALMVREFTRRKQEADELLSHWQSNLSVAQAEQQRRKEAKGE